MQKFGDFGIYLRALSESANLDVKVKAARRHVKVRLKKKLNECLSEKSFVITNP